MSKKSPRRLMVEMAMLKILNSRIGAENGMTREELLMELRRRGFSEFDPELMHLDDRDMRKALESIRLHEAEGAYLISIRYEKRWVYCRARDMAEFREAMKPEWSRAITMISRVKNQINRAYPELLGQLELQEGV